MTTPVLALLFVAAVLGGALNSVAGGGSFISFPALLFAGVPPVVANATNTLALWPGGVASAFAYRAEVRPSRATLIVLSLTSLAGGVAGAALLLRTRESTFVSLIPWLLLAASLVFTLGPTLSARIDRSRTSRRALVGLAAAQLGIAVYGGYFGAGIGILQLAALSFFSAQDIHAMNALKTILSSVINGVAVVIFVAAGAIAWRVGALMVVGGIVGGWFGARLARQIAPRRVRAFVVLVAWAMTAWFFARAYVVRA